MSNIRYFIYWNQEKTIKISVRGPTEFCEETVKNYKKIDIELIEVGWFSYFLMAHNFPKLAMLPLWN